MTLLIDQKAVNWAGTYQVGNDCNTAECCCLSGTATVTQSGLDVAIDAGLSGACNGQTTAQVSFTLASDSSDSASFTYGDQSYTATLDTATHEVEVTNVDYPQCSNWASCVSGPCLDKRGLSTLGIVLIVLAVVVVLVGAGSGFAVYWKRHGYKSVN